MNKLKILLLALCLGGLTSSLGADSISNSIATTSPTTITENIILPEFQYTLELARKAGYPRHEWPEDPTKATATKYAKSHKK